VILPASASQVAGITGVGHHAQVHTLITDMHLSPDVPKASAQKPGEGPLSDPGLLLAPEE
jgi:hypothetical protein